MCASKTSSGPSGSNQPTGFFAAGLEQTDFTSKTFPKKKPFSTFLGKNSTAASADVDIWANMGTYWKCLKNR